MNSLLDVFFHVFLTLTVTVHRVTASCEERDLLRGAGHAAARHGLAPRCVGRGDDPPGVTPPVTPSLDQNILHDMQDL